MTLDEDRLTQWCHENPKRGQRTASNLYRAGRVLQVDGFPCNYNSTDAYKLSVETSGKSGRPSLRGKCTSGTPNRMPSTGPTLTRECDCGWAQICGKALAPARGLPEEPSPDPLVGAPLQDPRAQRDRRHATGARCENIYASRALQLSRRTFQEGRFILETPIGESHTAPRTRVTPGDERHISA